MKEQDRQAALDALERILSYTNGLGDGEAYTIRAALSAQKVVGEKMTKQDKQAALGERYSVIKNPRNTPLREWAVIDKKGDAELGNWIIAECTFYNFAELIRAALTAQEQIDALYGTIKSQKQTHDALIKMNKELLDACKVVLGHMTGGMDGDWRDCDPIILLRDTIYRAEAQKVEED